MNKLTEEINRMQMQYYHAIEGLIMKSFHRRFGRTMTTIDAIDCRVDHKLGGNSTYYWFDKPFLEVEKQGMNIKEDGDTMTATTPLVFKILSGD